MAFWQTCIPEQRTHDQCSTAARRKLTEWPSKGHCQGCRPWGSDRLFQRRPSWRTLRLHWLGHWLLLLLHPSVPCRRKLAPRRTRLAELRNETTNDKEIHCGLMDVFYGHGTGSGIRGCTNQIRKWTNLLKTNEGQSQVVYEDAKFPWFLTQISKKNI